MSYCECSSEGEQPIFIRKRIVTARKPHTCCECDEPIEVGERFEFVAGKWDTFDTFKTCLFCAEERARLRRLDPDGAGPCFTQLACCLNQEIYNAVWDQRHRLDREYGRELRS